MRTHTPAPWFVTHEDSNTIKVTGETTTGERIATIKSPHWDDEAVGNALLIAAAPEMLDDLKALVLALYLLEVGERVDLKPLVAAARATIEKAGGSYE